MLRGVWVPCWRDVARLAAPPFEDRGADGVSWVTGVVSWLLRGVCETAHWSIWTWVSLRHYTQEEKNGKIKISNEAF